MPTFETDGNTIVYALFGTGPLLVWNAGGREPGLGTQEPLASHLNGRYAVLVWDRRNSGGASDICLSGASGPTVADAADLNALLNHLDRGPACIGGGSAGCALSLHMAARYPHHVSSVLALKPASMDTALLAMLAEHLWFALAEAAASGGMQAVIDLSQVALENVNAGNAHDGDRQSAWLARSLEANPGNRDRLLSMDPAALESMMRSWGDALKAHGGGLAELGIDEIRSITAPTLIIPGDDPMHPAASAHWLAEQLPRVQIVQAGDDTEITTAEQWWGTLWPVIDEFLDQNPG